MFQQENQASFETNLQCSYSFLALEESKDNASSILAEKESMLSIGKKHERKEKKRLLIDTQNEEDEIEGISEISAPNIGDQLRKDLKQPSKTKSSMFAMLPRKDTSGRTQVELLTDEEISPLLYGDKIYLSLTGDEQKRDKCQIMFSRGYIDPSFAFIDNQVLSQDVLDLYNCCLQVLPSVDYVAETKVRKLMDKGNYEMGRSLTLIGNIDTAVNQNLKIQKELIGKPVLYGDNIILLHCSSGMFLEVRHQKKQSEEKRESEEARMKKIVLDRVQQQILKNFGGKSPSNQDVRSTSFRSNQSTQMSQMGLNIMKEFSSFNCHLTPYLSEWTQFQFNEFLTFQKDGQNKVQNRQFTYLAHSQPNLNLRLNASFEEGEVVFGESKQELLIERVKQSIDQETDDPKMLRFEEMDNRYVWMTAVYEDSYLNVKKQGHNHEKGAIRNDESQFQTTMYEQTTEHMGTKIFSQKTSGKIAQKFPSPIKNDEILLSEHSAGHAEKPKAKVDRGLVVHFKKVDKNDKQKDEYQIFEEYMRGSKEKNGEMQSWEDNSKYMKSGIWFLEFVKREEDYKNITKAILKNIFFNKFLTINQVQEHRGEDGESPIEPKYEVVLTDAPESNSEFEINFVDGQSDQESVDDQKPLLIRLLKRFDDQPDQPYVLCLQSEVLESQTVKRQRLCTLDPFYPDKHWVKRYRDVFRLVSPSNDEIWEIRFLAEYKGILENNLGTFQTKDLLKALKGIKDFLTNKIVGKISKVYEYGEIMKERQDALRQFGIFSICLKYLEPLKVQAQAGNHQAYQCSVRIFKIAKAMTQDHTQNQITFYEVFDELKDYISNSRKICQIISQIFSNSQFLMKKMVKVTNDVPSNILELKHDDSFFNQNASDKNNKETSKPTKLLGRVHALKESNTSDDLGPYRPNKGSVQENKMPLTLMESDTKRTTLMDVLSKLKKNSSLRGTEDIELDEEEGINIHKIIKFFVQRMKQNEKAGKSNMNIYHLQILQQFIQVSIDEGIFWNQWFIFKELFPSKKNEQVSDGKLKSLKLKTFLPLYFKDDQTMFIGKEDSDLTFEELKEQGLTFQSVKQQLSIICSLCAGENLICISFFKKYFTEEVLTSLLKRDTPHSKYIRPQVLNLLYVLYLSNTYAQNRVQIPEFIWYEQKEGQSQEQDIPIITCILDEAASFFSHLGEKNSEDEYETVTEEELNLEIANQYLQVFIRCLRYNKDFFKTETRRMLFKILGSIMKHAFSFSQDRPRLDQTFQYARELEMSKRINLQFIRKVITEQSGSMNADNQDIDKQGGVLGKILSQGFQEGDDMQVAKKLEQIIPLVLGSGINTKIDFIKKICNLYKSKVPIYQRNLRHLASENVTKAFQILNNFERQKTSLFITKFLQKYTSYPQFQQDGLLNIKQSKLETTIDTMMEEVFQETEVQFRNMMIAPVEQKINKSATLNSDSDQFDIHKLLINPKFEEQFHQFVILFDSVESLQTQEELMQLYFNMLNEKQNNIECLQKMIFLREKKEIQNYQVIKECLINLSKYHESSEVKFKFDHTDVQIWLYNQDNFASQSEVILPNIEKIIEVLENNQAQRQLYQFIMSQLEGDSLIVKMLREYKPYISKIIMNRNTEFDSSIYENFIKRLYDLITLSLRSNHAKKQSFIDMIDNFYPISVSKDLGEVRIASQIMKFKDSMLSTFQLQTLHTYIRNVWKDLKLHKEENIFNLNRLSKVKYLLKMMKVLLDNSHGLEEDLIQYIVQFALSYNIMLVKDSSQMKIVNLLFEVLMIMKEKNMFRRFQVDQLIEVFSLKNKKIEEYFRHMQPISNNLYREYVLSQAHSSGTQGENEMKKLQATINANLRSLFFALFSSKIQKQEDKNKFNQMISMLLIDKIDDEVEHYSVEKIYQVFKQLRLIQEKAAKTKKNSEILNRIIFKIQDQYQNQINIQTKVRRQILKSKTLGNWHLDEKEADLAQSEEVVDYTLPLIVVSYLKRLIKEGTGSANQIFGEMVLARIQQSAKEKENSSQVESKMINMYRKMIEVLQLGTQINQRNISVIQIQNIINMVNSIFYAIEKSDNLDAVKTYDFKEFQQNLDGLSYTETILELMCQQNSQMIQMQPDFLFTMNNMLINGPCLIQDKIYEYFTMSNQAEAIFSNMTKFIDDAVRQLRYQVQVIQERKNQIQSYSNITSILRKKTTFKNSVNYLLENVVLFIKQLCEGHHSQIQQYLTNQSNFTQSENLMLLIIKFMDQVLICLFQVRTDLNEEFINGGHFAKERERSILVTEEDEEGFLPEEKKIIKKTLDQLLRSVNVCLITILEMIQGPCIQNQKILLDSQFMELAKKILDQSYLNTMAKTRGKYMFWNDIYDARVFDYRLQIIKTNLLQVILELLDGPQKEDVLVRIQQSISIQDLEDNILRFYKMMKVNGVEYGDSLFFNIFKEYDEIFDKKLVKGRKVVVTKPGEYDSWLIIECAINAQIAREIILESYKIYKNKLEEDKYQFLNVFLIQSLKNYTLLWFKFIKDLVYSVKCCKSRAFLRKENKPKLREESIKFMEDIIKSIEIMAEGKRQTIYFPKIPLCNFLSKDIKDNFEQTCDRTSTKSKIESIMNMQQKVIINMQSEAQYMNNLLFRYIKIFPAFALNVNLFKDTAFYFLICIHIFILATFDSQGYYAEFRQIYAMQPYLRILDILVYIMLSFASFIFVFVVIKRIFTTFIEQKLNLIADSEKALLSKNQGNTNIDMHEFKQTKLQKVLLIFIVIGQLLTDFGFLYYLLYIIFAILAVIVHPFYLAYHLLDIFVRSPMLQSILMAIYEPKEQLMLTILLFLIIEYILALISSDLLWYDFPTDTCSQSLLMCYVIMIDQTFKAGGGVGGFMFPPYNTQVFNDASTEFDTDPQQDAFLPGLIRDDPAYSSVQYKRILFDQVANFLLLILILQIFAGIIIDTFSKLREGQNIITDDMKNNCFICGMRRDEIERQEKKADAFRLHTEIKHSHWNYIFYLCFLKQKPKNEYTGVETYIMTKIHNEDNGWFPDPMQETPL